MAKESQKTKVAQTAEDLLSTASYLRYLADQFTEVAEQIKGREPIVVYSHKLLMEGIKAVESGILRCREAKQRQEMETARKAMDASNAGATIAIEEQKKKGKKPP